MTCTWGTLTAKTSREGIFTAAGLGGKSPILAFASSTFHGKQNSIGRLDFDGAYSSYLIPSADAEPHGLVLGPDGAIWFAEESGVIGRFSLPL